MPPQFPRDKAWPPLDVRPLDCARDVYKQNEAPKLKQNLGDIVRAALKDR